MKCDIFKCNLKVDHVKEMNILSPFWHDVMYSWCKFNFSYNKPVRQQTIWYNSNVLINKKVCYIDRAYSKGLLWVYQLYPDGILISATQAMQLYGLSVMELNSLVSAIPSEWRNFLKNKQPEDDEQLTEFEKIKTVPNIARYAYLCFSNQSINTKVLDKWHKIHSTTYSEKFKATQFKRLYTVTNSSKIRSFNYRMLHGALVLNTHLYRWNMRSDNLCSFCETNREDVQHLFFECKYVIELWEKVKKWLSETPNGYCIELTFENVFFTKLVIITCVTLFVH